MDADLKASLRRVRQELAEEFYSRFLKKDPRIEAHFANTDFAKQKRLLLHGLQMLIDYSDDDEFAILTIKHLARRHGRKEMSIEPNLYPIWINTLVETMRHLDKGFTRETERHLREAVQPGIDYMITYYNRS